MPREALPNRRLQITSTVFYQDPFSQGRGMEFEISFGFNTSYVLKELFINSKSHPLTPLLNDICILISRLLQHGDSIESIAEGLGENRNEGEALGAPSSFVGAIARQGCTVQADMRAT
jgi:hypothetical protein